MSLPFYMPVKLCVGEGSVRAGSGELKKLGSRCLIVTGRNSAKACGALSDAHAALEAAGVAYELFDEITQNPYLSTCFKAAKAAREFKADFILGIGGGSPLDAAKAIAVLAANEKLDGNGLYLGGWSNPALPLALIGTTAGTGSEVTPYAVITDDLGSGTKKAVRDSQCFAAVAFGDARYTNSLSYSFTLSTALDALTHATEACLNKQATDITDIFAFPAIREIATALPAIRGKAAGEITAVQREKLYLASIFAGVAIAYNGTSYCHSLGYFLTERYDVAHGMACAAYLPHYIRRAARLNPERAAQLEAAIGISCGELCAIIESCTELPEISITREEAAEIAGRYEGSGNYKNAYGDFNAAGACEVLAGLFCG